MSNVNPSDEEIEMARKEMAHTINSQPSERELLEAEHGQVWNTEELGRDYVVEGFAAPLVVVRRKSDNKRGSLFFQHYPRFYYGFEEHRGS